MATEKFSKWCMNCYSRFTDPVKYEEHIAVCGKPPTEATEPVQVLEPQPETANEPTPPTEATEPVKTSSRSKTKTK